MNLDKNSLKETAIALLSQKLSALQSELSQLQISANNETKSSMGDKYETGREIITQEKNKLGAQVELVQSQLNFMQSIDAEKKCEIVKEGALIQTDTAYFFISVPIGEISFEGKKIFLVSAQAPLIREMSNHKAGELVLFNKRKILLKAIS